MLDDVTDSISKGKTDSSRDSTRQISGKDIPGTQAGEQIDYLITKVIIPTLQKVLFDDFSLQADHGVSLLPPGSPTRPPEGHNELYLPGTECLRGQAQGRPALVQHG